MEDPKVILLFSKYSSNSKKLLDLFKNINLRLLNIQTICIDNADIRKRIKNSKTIEIKTVPCILVLYSDGGVEKFDGDNVFQFSENIINNYMDTQPVTQAMSQAQVQAQAQAQAQSQMQAQPQAQVQAQAQAQVQPQQQAQAQVQAQAQSMNQSKPKQSNATLIEDLLDGDEIIENEEDENQEKDDGMSKYIKSNGGGILMKAQELAKARENEEPKKK